MGFGGGRGWDTAPLIACCCACCWRGLASDVMGEGVCRGGPVHTTRDGLVMRVFSIEEAWCTTGCEKGLQCDGPVHTTRGRLALCGSSDHAMRQPLRIDWILRVI